MYFSFNRPIPALEVRKNQGDRMIKSYIIKNRHGGGFVGMSQGEWIWMEDEASAYVFMWESVAQAVMEKISILTKQPITGEVITRYQ